MTNYKPFSADEIVVLEAECAGCDNSNHHRWLELARRANVLATAVIEYKKYIVISTYSPDRFLSVALALDAALSMYMGDDDE